MANDGQARRNRLASALDGTAGQGRHGAPPVGWVPPGNPVDRGAVGFNPDRLQNMWNRANRGGQGIAPPLGIPPGNPPPPGQFPTGGGMGDGTPGGGGPGTPPPTWLGNGDGTPGGLPGGTPGGPPTGGGTGIGGGMGGGNGMPPPNFGNFQGAFRQGPANIPGVPNNSGVNPPVMNKPSVNFGNPMWR
jgi:hypothetical protein